MSLPTLFLFERHWDLAPKQFLDEALDSLINEGYDTICVEGSPKQSSQELLLSMGEVIKQHSEIEQQAKGCLARVNISVGEDFYNVSFNKLTDLMRLYVSSQRYDEVADMVKTLPAARVMKKTFTAAVDRGMILKGIDIEDEDARVKMSEGSNSERIKQINLLSDQRNQTFVTQLMKLRQERSGIIFVCGALHAMPVIEQFHQRGLENEIVVLFPTSRQFLDDGFNDLEILTQSTYLKSIHILMDNEGERVAAIEKMINEIHNKNVTYISDVEKLPSHAVLLSKRLDVSIKALCKLGFHLDLLIELKQLSEHKIESLKEVFDTRVTTHENSEYLVIPNANLTHNVEKIRTFKPIS